jgi:CheY-like chemotaxis protein
MDLRMACVLLLEDDALIAIDAEDMLLGLGASRVLSAHTLAHAHVIVAEEAVDAAVLDVRIGGGRCDGLARSLVGRSIPFIFASGEVGELLPDDLSRAPRVSKPYDAEALRHAFEALPASTGDADRSS